MSTYIVWGKDYFYQCLDTINENINKSMKMWIFNDKAQYAEMNKWCSDWIIQWKWVKKCQKL